MQNERINTPGTASENTVIPIVEEYISVDKVAEETGRIKIIKTVREENQELEVTLKSEDLKVERVPVNYSVEQIPQTRTEGNVTIIPLVKEILVVEKRLVVYEEIRITKNQTLTNEKIPTTVKKEEAEIREIRKTAE